MRNTRETEWRLGDMKLRFAPMQTDLSGLSKGDDPAIDGIIGNDITRRWRTRWDFANGQLQLFPAASVSDLDECQANALPTRRPGLQDFGFIKMTLGATKVEAIALIDTGAAQTILNGEAARRLGLRMDGSDARLRVRKEGTQGLGGAPAPTWLYDLSTISTFGWQRDDLEVRISALSIFTLLGLGDLPAVILGADAMADSQIEISPNAERICLRRITG